MLANRPNFWLLDSDMNYTNDTICILNDQYKINILLVTKCASTTIRNFIECREKLLSQLNEEESMYTQICFTRPVEERFYSGFRTIFHKQKLIKKSDFIKRQSREGLLRFIIGNEDVHITPISILLKGARIDHIYNLKVLDSINYKRNVSKRIHEDHIDKIKDMNIFDDVCIQEHYFKDYEYHNKSSMYVTPAVSQLFGNKLSIQKFLFILTPAFNGSSTIASLIDSSPNTSFGDNVKYEGLLSVKPRSLMTKSSNWYNLNYEPDYSDIMKIQWDDKPIKCDKYPPYMLRAKEIEKYFEQFGDVYFICSTRHPYSSRHQIEWNTEIEIMHDNLKSLKRVHFMRYEDLLYNYDREVDRLLKFLPELNSLDKDKVTTSHCSRGPTNGIIDCQDYTRSRGNFNKEYMKEFGYLEEEPYVLI